MRTIDQYIKTHIMESGLFENKSLQERARYTFVMKNAGTLVISPTRELATQIANEALRLTAHHPKFQVHLLVGGESKRQQGLDWRRRSKDLVVATPGRLKDMLESGHDFANALKHTELVGAFFSFFSLVCELMMRP